MTDYTEPMLCVSITLICDAWSICWTFFYFITGLPDHLCTLAWKIPWMEEPGRLQSMGLLRVGHDSGTSLSLFTLMHWRRKWHPTPVWGAWWAAVYGVAQSRTRLKWLGSSGSMSDDLLLEPHTDGWSLAPLETIFSISLKVLSKCIMWSSAYF